MKKILVIGSGAIGRGYVPWLFDLNKQRIDFVDTNRHIVDALNTSGSYLSYMTVNNSYKTKDVIVGKAYHSSDLTPNIIENYDFLITSVGPRNFLSLAELFKAVRTPVVCFENGRDLVTKMRVAANRENIYFGIPDVISSNAKDLALFQGSDLSLITESGKTFVEQGAGDMHGDITYCSEEEIRKQWAAKLYIHNTPHCIAAYLGNICGCSYLHEAMQIPKVRDIVVGATYEMQNMVLKDFNLDKEFVEAYSIKEINRFSNTLLYDPISRVAREPFRKLGLNDRLIGAARKAYVNNISPKNVLTGIMSAFLFNNKDDSDAIISYLFDTLDNESFLSIAIGLSPHSVVTDALLQSWDENLVMLHEIKNDFQ